MALSDLTDPAAVKQAIKECDRLGRDAFLAVYGFQRARDWVLVQDGREYDSKAIAGVAHGIEHPELGPLSSNDFTGGISTVVRKLRSLGFTVRSRRAPSSPVVRAGFNRGDCALFERYPRKVPFKDELVPRADKRHFKHVRLRLKAIAQDVASGASLSVPLRAEASSYSQNGRSQTDLWACAYPRSVPNKSYALQLAIIVSAAGAEVCLCLGAGQSQSKDPQRKADSEAALAKLKAALRAAPRPVRDHLTRSLGNEWQLRRRWREPAGTRDFIDLDAWLAHAASPDGNGAAISRNFTPSELEAHGSGIIEVLLELASAAAPLIEHAYGAAEAPAESLLVPDPGELASSLHLDEPFLSEIAEALKDRRQVILYGPPGTGKTYVARKLIEQLAPDESQREIVQFHPSYSYEDFVLGFRPALSAEGDLAYTLQPGPLLRLARRAAAEPGRRHVLLIDEINRGNLPRIFGELLYLLEYRGERISLMYTPPPGSDADDLVDEHGRFALPANLWLVGTMNTADRSIGLIDAALRRRFHFIPFFPGHGALDGLLGRWLAATQGPAVQPLAGWVDELNARLRKRFNRHLQVGHSYFMRKQLSLADVERIWAADIMPFLEDQLFDQADGALREFELAAIREGAGRADDPPD